MPEVAYLNVAANWSNRDLARILNSYETVPEESTKRRLKDLVDMACKGRDTITFVEENDIEEQKKIALLHGGKLKAIQVWIFKEHLFAKLDTNLMQQLAGTCGNVESFCLFELCCSKRQKDDFIEMHAKLEWTI